jgi:hypothetical protein
MLTQRNLQFYGFAYGDTPVTLDVKVNGQTVFSNAVSTIPGAVPIDTNDIICDQVLFEVNDTGLFPITFNGDYTHSVAVGGGNGVLLGEIKSNYTGAVSGNTTVGGNATGFVNVYYGTPINSEGSPDCRSSVYIDGVQQVPPLVPSLGTWTWQVDNGSNLSCNLNIRIGNVAV